MLNVSVMEKILRPQTMISDEGVRKNTRGRVCSPFFPNLIAVPTACRRNSSVPLQAPSKKRFHGLDSLSIG